MTAWRVPPAETPGDIGDFLEGRGAAQVNLYRALANAPEMVRAWRSFIWDLRDRCTTPRALRELVILRCAVRHASPYEWTHHVTMARSAGLTEEQIDSVEQWEAATCFSDPERLALELTDGVCDCAVSDDLAARGTGRFGAEGYVELSLTAAVYAMVPRVLDALGVPLEDTGGSEPS